LRISLTNQNIKTKELKWIVFVFGSWGMNYLHSYKPLPILHRDLNSSNILVWRFSLFLSLSLFLFLSLSLSLLNGWCHWMRWWFRCCFVYFRCF
jgi:hypothetical protein